MIFFELFYRFLLTGLFAIGGGMATLPFLQRMGEETGWFTTAELANMVAISESTPGPIGVNMATYVGFVTGGRATGNLVGSLLGAVIASIGLILPSLIIILIVAKLLQRFRDSRYVSAAFYGLRPASAALITSALIGIISIALLNTALFRETGKVFDLISLKSILLAAVLVFFTRFCKKTKNLHPIVFIAFSALIGILFRYSA